MTGINLSDGKYTVVNELEEGGGFKALRYGEEWRDLTGDNLVLVMYREIEELREQVAEVERLKLENSSLKYDNRSLHNTRNRQARRIERLSGLNRHYKGYADRFSEDISEYKASIRNLGALADSVRYRISSQQDSEAIADEIVGVISELERKVGEIT